MKLEGQIRIENVDIKELVTLLTEAYQRSDYVDVVIDPDSNNIYLEPPEGIEIDHDYPIRPVNQPIILLNEIEMTPELFRLLLK
jgi:hypothetical protein